MKVVKLVNIVILALAVASCSRGPAPHATLAQAERVADVLPDSAIMLLAPLTADSFATDADRALYGLVLTEAAHRSGVNIASDSLIAQSLAYYQAHGDRNRTARALLHRGIVLYAQQRLHEAVDCMKQAEQLAERLDDHALGWLLMAVLGDVNDNAQNPQLTLHYYHRALSEARLAQNNLWTARALNNIATTYDMLGMPDSMQAYVERALPLLPQLDRETRATTLCNRGSLLLQRGDTLAAVAELQRSLTECFLDKAVKLLADVAACRGDSAHARQLWGQALYAVAPDVRADAFRSLIGLLTSSGATEQALLLSQRLNDDYRRHYEQADAAGIILMQAQYDQQRQERRQYRLAIASLATVSVLLALIIGFGYYHRRRVRAYDAAISDVSARLSDMEQLHAKLTDHARQRRQQLPVSPAAERLHALARRGQAAQPADFQALHAAYRELFPQFLSLLETIPSLTPRDVNVCLLIRLSFAPTEVAVLTAQSPQQVTNLRARLFPKLFGQKGGAREFDERLKELVPTP